MAYASASQVATYCRNLLGSASAFSASTLPTLDEINTLLSSGCGIIEANLSARGYAVPAASSTGFYDVLSDLNAIYAVAQAEMARTNVVLGMGERTRGQVFEKEFWSRLETLLATDLSPYLSVDTAHVYVGGISESVRDTYDDDTDRISPRFKRDMF